MDWWHPKPAIRVIVYEQDGGIAHYGRETEADGEVVWRKGKPEDPWSTFPGASMSAEEFRAAIEASLF